MGGYQIIDASAAGAFLSGGGNLRKTLAGARLVAGVDDATAVIRETDGSGRVLATLSALEATADETGLPVEFTGNVHVTLTGTAPACYLYQP